MPKMQGNTCVTQRKVNENRRLNGGIYYTMDKPKTPMEKAKELVKRNALIDIADLIIFYEQNKDPQGREPRAVEGD